MASGSAPLARPGAGGSWWLGASCSSCCWRAERVGSADARQPNASDIRHAARYAIEHAADVRARHPLPSGYTAAFRLPAGSDVKSVDIPEPAGVINLLRRIVPAGTRTSATGGHSRSGWRLQPRTHMRIMGLSVPTTPFSGPVLSQASVRRARCWRIARRTSSTVPRPAFVSPRVREGSAVVVTPSVRGQQPEPGCGQQSRGRFVP